MATPGYQVLQELSCNEWSILHRGHRRQDGRSVLLKTPRHDPPSATEIALLAYEHEILRGLSVSGIPKALDLLSADRGCCLVLEDRGAALLQTLLVSRRPDLEGFFQLALQLCTILVALHRQD